MKSFILTFLSCFIASFLHSQPKVIDEVVAAVGNDIVLLSDVENQYIQYKIQGISDGKQSKCEIFETLLYEKLLLNQAKIDSIEVTESQIENELDRRLRYFINQIGSKEQLETYFNKSIVEIKDEFRSKIKDQLLINQMQQDITKNIKVTPSEVREFFNSIPKDSLPYINTQFEIGQIVKQPLISEEERKMVKERLNGLRERALKGESFATLAIMYSDDEATAGKGGELGFINRGQLQAEFEAVAFNLKKDSVSEIIETQYGFHIIQLIERRGESINVRHILLRPKVSVFELQKAKVFLDSIAELIEKDSMTFAEAAHKFSDDVETKNNGGLIVNPLTESTYFEADQIDATIFFAVDKLTSGEISAPVLMNTPEGKQAYRILYLKSRTEPHYANLKDDYEKIQQIALTKKQAEEISDWINKKKKSTYIKINKEYLDCEFHYDW